MLGKISPGLLLFSVSRIVMRSYSRIRDGITALLLGGCISLLIFILQPTSIISDPDALYHRGMIELTAVLVHVSDFPWATYSTLVDRFADHQWLYHVLGTPFLLLGSETGYHVYTATLAGVLAVILYLFLRHQRVRFPIIFIIIALTSVPVLFRLSAGKITALSLVCAIGILWAARERKPVLVGFLSALYALAYSGFPLGIALVVLFLIIRAIYDKDTRLLYDKTAQLQAMAVMIGSSIGAIMHPGYPKYFYMIADQFFHIGVRNYQSIVGVGAEWYPVTISQLIGQSSIVVMVFAVGAIAATIHRKHMNALGWTFFAAAFIFGVLSFKSQRYIEYAIPFAAIAGGFGISAFCGTASLQSIISHFLSMSDSLRRRFDVLLLAGISVLIIVLSIHGVYRYTRTGMSDQRLTQASQWLSQNSEKNSIVFHARWDDFAFLWYHNKHNRYIVGLDPTFMYLKDPALYRTYQSLTEGRVVNDVGEALAQFHPDYVLVLHNTPALGDLLNADERYQVVYTDDEATIYAEAKTTSSIGNPGV